MSMHTRIRHLNRQSTRRFFYSIFPRRTKPIYNSKLFQLTKHQCMIPVVCSLNKEHTGNGKRTAAQSRDVFNPRECVESKSMCVV